VIRERCDDIKRVRVLTLLSLKREAIAISQGLKLIEKWNFQKKMQAPETMGLS
jgi:hypothetical protein